MINSILLMPWDDKISKSVTKKHSAMFGHQHNENNTSNPKYDYLHISFFFFLYFSILIPTYYCYWPKKKALHLPATTDQSPLTISSMWELNHKNLPPPLPQTNVFLICTKQPSPCPPLSHPHHTRPNNMARTSPNMPTVHVTNDNHVHRIESSIEQ